MPRLRTAGIWIALLALILGAAATGAAVASQGYESATIAAKDDQGAELPLRGKKKKDKEEEAKGGGGGQAGAKKDEPAFDEVIKDAQKIEGLLTVYTKDGRYLLALKPDQLDKEFMVSLTRETGIGQTFLLLAAQVVGENPVTFHRSGKKIQMLLKNTRFTAVDDPEMRRAVTKSFSDSLAGSAKIESQPHPETQAILVDMSSFFVSDVEAIGSFLGESLKTPYNLDRENSSITAVKPFPKNMEIEARLHMASGKPYPGFVNLPDPRSMFLTYRYSVSEVPAATDYIPRLADDRVGYFITMYQDFSDDHRESPYVRYVTRWNLQKEEPYALLSKPKEPITFWLENNIPKQYRKAVADGILLWNTAFERVGFKDAVVVKQQPDDADWDPADARYSTVRWFVTTSGSFAIGPSRINPHTGQIYDADIGVAESIVRNTRQEFVELVDPVTAIRAMAASIDPSLDPAASLRPVDPRFACTHATGATQQAAFGYSMLTVRGMQPGSPEEEKYVSDFITHVMAHEVGHTLGLRHNFRASAVQPVDQLQNTALTAKDGLTGSVMDYTPVNIAPPGKTQGQHWQTTLGAYDMWAIEYAYTSFPGVKKPEDELAELAKIASRGADNGHHYGTDEDMWDPRTSMWDIGTDGIAYYKGRVATTQELWQKIPTVMSRPGEGYQVMRRTFINGLVEIIPAVVNVAKYIGGMYTHRDHVGDPQGRLPLQPVPADRQREALQFLKANLFDSGAFKLPPELLNKLAASRWWDFNFSIFQSPRGEFPLHDTVLTIQDIVLDQLYNPVRLDRLVDLEMHYASGQKPFTLAEMFNGIQESIWSEVYQAGAPRIDSFRRATQREHLKTLIDLVVKPASGTPEDATTMARANLSDLKARIEAGLKASQAAGDAATRAHLDESRARIEAALSAGMLRLTS